MDKQGNISKLFKIQPLSEEAIQLMDQVKTLLLSLGFKVESYRKSLSASFTNTDGLTLGIQYFAAGGGLSCYMTGHTMLRTFFCGYEINDATELLFLIQKNKAIQNLFPQLQTEKLPEHHK